MQKGIIPLCFGGSWLDPFYPLSTFGPATSRHRGHDIARVAHTPVFTQHI